MRDVNTIVIHCSATPEDMDIGVKEIRRWHLSRGFSDIGYHYVVRRNGSLEDGRHEAIPGAHAKGYNSDSIGVCIVGGLDDDGNADANFSMRQYISLSCIINELLVKYPTAQVLGHRDLPGVSKACPCFNAPLWVKGK